MIIKHIDKPKEPERLRFDTIPVGSLFQYTDDVTNVFVKVGRDSAYRFADNMLAQAVNFAHPLTLRSGYVQMED